VTAEYKTIKGVGNKVQVINSETYFFFGRRFTHTVKGLAKMNGEGKLRVSFDPFRWFYGDYWVLYKTDNVMYVGSSSSSFGWILTKEPDTNIGTLLDWMEENNIDLSKFQPVAQETRRPPNKLKKRGRWDVGGEEEGLLPL